MPVIEDHPGYPDVAGAPRAPCDTGALVIATAQWQDGSSLTAETDIQITLDSGEVRVGRTDDHGVVTFTIRGLERGSTIDFQVDGSDRHLCASHPLAQQVAADGTSHPLLLLRRVELHLQLQFRDPEGTVRNFPDGVMLDAVFGDGHRERVMTEAGGQLHFDDAGRPEDALANVSLAMAQTGRNLVSEPPDEERIDRWVEDAHVSGWVRDGYRVIAVPDGLTTITGVWRAALSDTVYADGVFHPLQGVGRTVGTPDAPVDLVLRPTWQFLRLTYYDRVTEADDQVSIPPLWLQAVADGDDGWEDRPAAASNWTVGDDPLTACQCVPWIDQSVAKPDTDVVIRFRTANNTFIHTDQDQARTVDVVDPTTIASHQRLRYYDLPVEWRSSNHFVRTAARGTADGEVFEELDDVSGSADEPLIFSLDDIVVVSEHQSPVEIEEEDRVAVFSHRFGPGPGLDAYGLYRKSPAAELQRYPFSQARTYNVRDMGGYISEYPDWTRLVVLHGGLFDVFDRRVQSPMLKLYGQRAAVDWLGALGRSQYQVARAAGCTVQSQFRQQYPDCSSALPVGAQDFAADRWAGGATKNVGISDVALLRHCGLDDDTERAVMFQYVTFELDFEDDFEDDEDGEEDDDFTVKQGTYARTAIDQSIARWAGPDDAYNPGRPRIIKTSGGPAMEVDTMWFCQSHPDHSRYQITVKLERRRTHMTDAGTGDWGMGDHAAGDDGSHAAAHELGHAMSLPDEYSENATKCSYGLLPVCSNGIFGDPYRGDTTAMMKGNRHVRARYYWHLAEWLHTEGLGDFRIEHDGRRYQLPHQTNNQIGALRTFVNWPLSAWSYNPGAGPTCDVYVYALGNDAFTRGLIDGFVPRGLIDIDIKLSVTAALDPEWDHDRGTYYKTQTTLDLMSDMVASRSYGLGKRWKASGTVGDIALTDCLVRFNLRFLVETYNADEDIYPRYNALQSTPGQIAARAYNLKVGDLSGRHRPAMRLRLGDHDPVLAGGRISVRRGDVDKVPRFISMQLGLVADEERYLEDLADMSWRDHVDLAPLLGRVLDDVEVEAI